MKKRVLLPALLIGTLLTGSIALAGPGFGSGNCDRSGHGKNRGAMSYEQHEDRMEQRLEKMSTILDLTDDQEDKIEALFNQQWQNNQSRRTAMQASRDEMHEAMNSTDFNEVDFRAKAAKHSELKTEKMVERAKMKQQLYAILTPEQQEKAEKLHLGMGRGKGHHGRSGMGF